MKKKKKNIPAKKPKFIRREPTGNHKLKNIITEIERKIHWSHSVASILLRMEMENRIGIPE